MVLAGPDAMGAPTKDLSWLSANVVFANSRIQTIFKSTSLPSAVIWAKEILLLRTAFNFQNRLSRGVIKGNDGGESPFWWYNPSLRCQKHVCIRTEFALRRWMIPMIKQSHILYRPCWPSPTRDFHSLQISQPYCSAHGWHLIGTSSCRLKTLISSCAAGILINDKEATESAFKWK
ncbi:hypothetical protein HCDG_08874 [Histoplasma capsulatum H143]|uniref:Uncharacterized protein n=1 Tax=Ajellomyces capsulatus (strain H143) TaxID=544712 RepID=C6HQF6_AJECH|nr:hypothetical protein HCDG_08874 [Histoplasma capsulatum H143]